LKAGYPDKKGALHAMLARALRRLGRDEEARQAAAEAAKLADASLESGENGNTDAHQ
jgi:Flp pilus assembly protein TadD